MEVFGRAPARSTTAPRAHSLHTAEPSKMQHANFVSGSPIIPFQYLALMRGLRNLLSCRGIPIPDFASAEDGALALIQKCPPPNEIVWIEYEACPRTVSEAPPPDETLVKVPHVHGFCIDSRTSKPPISDVRDLEKAISDKIEECGHRRVKLTYITREMLTHRGDQTLSPVKEAEHFRWSELQMNWGKQDVVPEQRIIDHEELEWTKTAYHATNEQLPRLGRDDMATKFLGGRQGDATVSTRLRRTAPVHYVRKVGGV
jgi:DNA-directed RNA polymerase subunit H (RpoH/RPB5)